MTTNLTTTERTRRRYNGVVYGCYAVGIAAMFIGLTFGYELLGSIVYLLGIVAGSASSLLIKRLSSVAITDERDKRLAERTSFLAIRVVVTVGLAIFPVLFVLDAAGQYTFTPLVEGVLYSFSALGLLWGACYLLVKYVL